jgi:hypothetical protein
MLSRFSTASLAAAALVLSAAPLAAQRSTNAISGGPARIVATYGFLNSPRNLALPQLVTLADSAGIIKASAAVSGGNTTIPLDVTVIDTHLILQGQTADGVLTLVLDRQNEGGATKLATGTWTLGGKQGLLRAQR